MLVTRIQGPIINVYRTDMSIISSNNPLKDIIIPPELVVDIQKDATMLSITLSSLTTQIGNNTKTSKTDLGNATDEGLA